MTLTTEQWLIGVAAALLIGFSKTGLPGIGILVIPLMAAVFGGRMSVGATLPLLIFGDIFAVLWYRHHARWDKLWGLIPWVLLGIVLGAILLWVTGEASGTKDALDVVIGVLVLAMLALNLVRLRYPDKLVPTTRGAVVTTGIAAGFSTTVSNAAGPIMSIYMTGNGLKKNEFMGTTAWYFFIFNLTKLPIYAFLSFVLPNRPMVTEDTLFFNLVMFPVIVGGAFIGKLLLPHISQKVFDTLVLVLAAAAAIKLILG